MTVIEKSFCQKKNALKVFSSVGTWDYFHKLKISIQHSFEDALYSIWERKYLIQKVQKY